MYAWQFQRLLSMSERRGWARFATMQNHYNLVYREEEREMIPLCQDEGIGVHGEPTVHLRDILGLREQE